MMNIGIYCRFGKEEQRDDKRAVSEKILKEVLTGQRNAPKIVEAIREISELKGTE